MSKKVIVGPSYWDLLKRTMTPNEFKNEVLNMPDCSIKGIFETVVGQIFKEYKMFTIADVDGETLHIHGIIRSKEYGFEFKLDPESIFNLEGARRLEDGIANVIHLMMVEQDKMRANVKSRLIELPMEIPMRRKGIF